MDLEYNHGDHAIFDLTIIRDLWAFEIVPRLDFGTLKSLVFSDPCFWRALNEKYYKAAFIRRLNLNDVSLGGYRPITTWRELYQSVFAENAPHFHGNDRDAEVTHMDYRLLGAFWSGNRVHCVQNFCVGEFFFDMPPWMTLFELFSEFKRFLINNVREGIWIAGKHLMACYLCDNVDCLGQVVELEIHHCDFFLSQDWEDYYTKTLFGGERDIKWRLGPLANRLYAGFFNNNGPLTCMDDLFNQLIVEEDTMGPTGIAIKPNFQQFNVVEIAVESLRGANGEVVAILCRMMPICHGEGDDDDSFDMVVSS